MPILDGTTSRTILLLAGVISVTGLAWHGTVDGQAYVAVITFLFGGIIHASGTRQGAQAAGPEPVDPSV